MVRDEYAGDSSEKRVWSDIGQVSDTRQVPATMPGPRGPGAQGPGAPTKKYVFYTKKPNKNLTKIVKNKTYFLDFFLEKYLKIFLYGTYFFVFF